MVFYRKYRPQKIADLDNNRVREMLYAVLAGEMPHAFLFTGPKGLGKTSAARIMAKTVNCTKRSASGGIEPCNDCSLCVSITNGSNIDILEIDAASNRGIDEIRDLKEKIQLAPVSSLYKVYIIDEVHMLTTEAFNALLKTLEEPPPHAIFILCTTEPVKVPATIVSRCFQVVFSPATEEELVRSFKRIVKGESLLADEGALKLIASLSEGGFRDGAKILEEISLLGNKKISKEIIEEKYHLTSISLLVEKLISALEKRNRKEALAVIAQASTQKIDIKYFTELLTTRLHALFLTQMGVLATTKETQPKEVFDIAGLLYLIARTSEELKYSLVAELPLELAVLEWLEGKDELTEGRSVAGSSEQEASPTLRHLRKRIGDIEKIKALYAVKEKNEDETKVQSVTSASLLHFKNDGEVSKEWRDLFWNSFIAEVKKHNHTTAGVLRSCMLKSFDKKDLVIETSYKFHQERLTDKTAKEILEQAGSLLLGKKIGVIINFIKPQKRG